MKLIHRKNLKKNINYNDLDINKVISHIIIQMFTSTNLKLELEKNVRLF